MCVAPAAARPALTLLLMVLSRLAGHMEEGPDLDLGNCHCSAPPRLRRADCCAHPSSQMLPRILPSCSRSTEMLCSLQSLWGGFICFFIPDSSERLDWWEPTRVWRCLCFSVELGALAKELPGAAESTSQAAAVWSL